MAFPSSQHAGAVGAARGVPAATTGTGACAGTGFGSRACSCPESCRVAVGELLGSSCTRLEGVARRRFGASRHRWRLLGSAGSLHHRLVHRSMRCFRSSGLLRRVAHPIPFVEPVAGAVLVRGGVLMKPVASAVLVRGGVLMKPVAGLITFCDR